MTPETGHALGHKLQRRRQDLAASAEQVAAWAGLSPDRFEEIEGGRAMAPWELEAVCRALAVDSGALARGDDRNPRRSVARFREAATEGDLQPRDLRLLALAAEVGRIGGFLAEALDQSPSALRQFREPRPVREDQEPWRQGYALGQRARGALTATAGAIPDVEARFVRLGIHVAKVPFEASHLEAASFWEPDSLPVILINPETPAARSPLSRRALLAHELCHLLHDSGERDLTTQLTWDDQKHAYGRAVEQRARAFAPAFLAPCDQVRHWFRHGEGRRLRGPEAKVEELARRWGFSFTGAVWHAKNCRIIQARTAERLGRQGPESGFERHSWEEEFESGRGGEDVVSPLGLPGASQVPSAVFRGLVGSLALKAAATGVISEGRAEEILSWE